MIKSVYLINCDEVNIPNDAEDEGLDYRGSPFYWEKLNYGVEDPIFKSDNIKYYESFNKFIDCKEAIQKGSCIILMSSTSEAYEARRAEVETLFKDVAGIGIVSMYMRIEVESQFLSYNGIFKNLDNIECALSNNLIEFDETAINGLFDNIKLGMTYSRSIKPTGKLALLVQIPLYIFGTSLYYLENEQGVKKANFITNKASLVLNILFFLWVAVIGTGVVSSYKSCKATWQTSKSLNDFLVKTGMATVLSIMGVTFIGGFITYLCVRNNDKELTGQSKDSENVKTLPQKNTSSIFDNEAIKSLRHTVNSGVDYVNALSFEKVSLSLTVVTALYTGVCGYNSWNASETFNEFLRKHPLIIVIAACVFGVSIGHLSVKIGCRRPVANQEESLAK